MKLQSLKITASPTLRKQVVETFRDAISTGKLAPGERLVERVLCDWIGVSRTSLREALRELENEGLITNLPNRGLIISTMDKKTAKNIFDVRAALEALICRLFCETATDPQLLECSVSFDRLSKAYKKNTTAKLILAKDHFYDVLMRGADNPNAERMLRSIHVRVSQLRLTSLNGRDRREESLTEIKALVEAILVRDGKTAERLSYDHVHMAYRAALGSFT
jgi:GntR family transcriptional regulator, trigonelline degradation regulator